MVLNFNAYAKEGNLFLKDCSEQFDLGEDKDKTSGISTDIMHCLRAIKPIEESLQLIAQLPMPLKALYVNGWTIKRQKPKIYKT